MLVIVLSYLGLSLFGPSILIFLKGLISMPDPDLDLAARVEILKSFTEMVAVVIAGIWTYELYIKNRYDHPYPKIRHEIKHYFMEKGFIYISVFVTVTNEGKTKLDLGSGKMILRQVPQLSPANQEVLENTIKNKQEDYIRLGKVEKLFIDEGQRIGWVTLGTREWKQLRGGLKELEPGQTREIQFDFLLLENDVQSVEAISYFEYAKSSWELVTLYSLSKSEDNDAIVERT